MSDVGHYFGDHCPGGHRAESDAILDRFISVEEEGVRSGYVVDWDSPSAFRRAYYGAPFPEPPAAWPCPREICGRWNLWRNLRCGWCGTARPVSGGAE